MASLCGVDCGTIPAIILVRDSNRDPRNRKEQEGQKMKLKDMMPWKSGSDMEVRRNEDPFTRLHREMGQMMDRFWNTDMDDFFHGQTPATSIFGGEPRVDVSVDDSNVYITAELPGVEEKDIDLSIKDGRLILSGEKKSESEDKKDGYYRKERSYGRFSRVISPGNEVDESKAKASFKNGVLRVTIPRTEKDKTNVKRIPISTTE